MRKVISSLAAAAVLAGAWVGVSALCGCSIVGKQLIERPKVALSSVGLKDVGAQGATVVFGLEVNNPNSIALKVDALRYDIEIGGKPLSSGRLEEAASVPAKDKAVIHIPVAVKYTDVFASLGSFFTDGTSQYRLRGEATFGFLTIPFDQTGELKLK